MERLVPCSAENVLYAGEYAENVRRQRPLCPRIACWRELTEHKHFPKG
jgi:hypothetical protein